MRRTIERNVSALQYIRNALGRRATEQRLQPCNQLRHGEWFHDIVISSGGKATHTVSFLATRRKHEDWHSSRVVAAPHSPAELDARHPWQHPIKDDKIELVFAKTKLGVFSRFCDGYCIPLGLDVEPNEVCQGGIILDNQDFQGRALHGFRFNPKLLFTYER
jgi:hypothetical protein